MKSSVGITLSCMRRANIMMCMPIRPMSWVSGIQVRFTSSSVQRDASPAPLAFGEDVPVREHDALGFARRAGGELDEGRVVGFDVVHLAGLRNVVDVLGEERARVQRIECRLLTGGTGKRADAVERLAIGVDERLSQFLRDAQQLVFVFVADAERHGHGHDAAEHSRPEGIQELLVVGEIDDELVAGSGAELLQVEQDAERAVVQLAVTHDPFAGLGLEITDGSFDAAVVGDQLGERFCFGHHL